MLDAEVSARIGSWVASAKGGDVAFVYAPTPGCGLSTTLDGVLDPQRYEVIKISGGQYKLKSFLVDVVSSAIAVSLKKKVLLLDPIDALFSDQVASMDLGECMRSHLPKVPIVIAGFRQRSSTGRAEDIFHKKFGYAPSTFVYPSIRAERAVEVLGRKFPDVSEDVIHEVWDLCQGDVRSATNALEFENSGAVKDTVCDGADAVKKIIFEEVPVKEATRILDGDVNMVSMGIFENYCVVEPLNGDVSDAFSLADVVDEMVFGKQKWELLDFYLVLVAGVPGQLLRPSETGKALPKIDKFGSVWSRSNNMRAKLKVFKNVQLNLVEKTQKSRLGITDVAMLRHMVGTMVGQQRHEGVSDLLGDFVSDPATVLGIMRLFRGSYTQTDHSKVRRSFKM